MAESPAALNPAIENMAGALADMLAGQDYAKKNRLEFAGSKMGPALTIPGIQGLVQHQTLVGESFRYQLRTLKPGGLSSEEIESIIKNPVGDNEKLIAKIAQDDTFYNNIATGMGSHLQGSAYYGRAQEQAKEILTKVFEERIAAGANEQEAIKAAVEKSSNIVDITKEPIYRIKLAIKQNTLRQLDDQTNLSETQEKALLDTNQKLFKALHDSGLYKERQAELGIAPPTEAQYLREYGSKKYKNEHPIEEAQPGIDKNSSLEGALPSKKVAYLAVEGISLKENAGKTDSMIAHVSPAELLIPQPLGKVANSNSLSA